MICEQCKFWEAIEVYTGFCVRYPAVVIPPDKSIWPKTAYNEWCGEFKENPSCCERYKTAPANVAPFFAINNTELDGLPKDEGGTILCEVCGERHKIEHGLKELDHGELMPYTKIGFVLCGGNKYLVSINGKRIVF